MPDPFAIDFEDDGPPHGDPPDGSSSRPITWLLVLGAACVVVSCIGFPLDGHVLDIVAYVLAAPVAFTLVALYRRAAERRLAQSGEAASRAASRAAVAVLMIGLAISIIHAYVIASYYA